METSNMFGSRNFVVSFNFTMILKIINKKVIIFCNGSLDGIRQIDFGAKYGS
jgi:hypothetical protein